MIKTIIVEDDYRVSLLHEKYLKQWDNIEVVGKALNAKELMDILKDTEADLLLLDIYMPDAVGTELLDNLRTHHPHLNVIIITAATDKEFLQTALRKGVVHYLIKPVSLTKFTETINEFLEKQAFLQNIEDVDQNVVDQYFQKGKNNWVMEKNLPTGIDELTLERVVDELKALDTGVTSEQLAEQIGVSRTTSRRYLEYLVSLRKMEARLDYGVVGRPERYYYPIS
ncbi:response regulator [Alteribacillus sp. HJP-4]|uniref:response regulator n=1 Tax=Alteribacillus sp. HJP-4 TaxID=2775394 RepID=UPI0035CD2814